MTLRHPFAEVIITCNGAYSARAALCVWVGEITPYVWVTPGAMRGHGGTAEDGSRRRVLFACPNTLDRRVACCAVGGAMFGNHFQG